MPSIQSPLGALPSRFRRSRVLIIGCGDVGLRVARQLPRHIRVLALTSSTERIGALRALGIEPLRGNLDHPSALRRLAGLGTRVLHLAPPLAHGSSDTRTRALLQALQHRTPPSHLVYGSTSGVYGDCRGAWVAESRSMNPTTDRALRRVDAETQLRRWARRVQAVACVLRIPGIYAPDREGGTPRARLAKGLPVLHSHEDVYTNHIHADDLARACIAALWRGQPQRAYNICDDTDLPMGAYFDLAADLYGLPRPPRVSRTEAAKQLSPMQMSFLQESRRLSNTRMKQELGVQLQYPSVRSGLAGS